MPAERLADFQGYHPPPSGECGLRLNANEGPPGVARGAEVAVGGRSNEEWLRRYPDSSRLESLIARRHQLDEAQVLVTAGVDDALYRVCMATLEPGRSMVLTSPTFEMLPKYARLAGGECVEVPWLRGSFPTAEIVAAARPDTALIVVVTPNNPTGLTAGAADLAAIANAAPGALLVIDHAYVEFADEDLTDWALKQSAAGSGTAHSDAASSAVVMRTFSKAWGLAGLRVGYALGPPRIIEWLRSCGNPYAVSGIALAIAAERFELGREAMLAGARRVREERLRLADLLAPHAAEVWRGQGNFVFARFERDREPASALSAWGVAVRVFGARPGLEGCVRITCPGDEDEFERLTAALREVFDVE